MTELTDLSVLHWRDLVRLGYAGSRSSVYRKVRSGKLPHPLPGGGWTVGMLKRWLEDLNETTLRA